MHITQITVLTRRGYTDELFIHTDLPPAIWPFTESPSLRMETVSGTGEEYAKLNFPNIPIELIKG